MRDVYEAGEHNLENNPVENEKQTSDVGSVAEESTKTTSATSNMSFTDCAEKVLEEFGGKNPMHYKDITSKALVERLVSY